MTRKEMIYTAFAAFGVGCVIFPFCIMLINPEVISMEALPHIIILVASGCSIIFSAIGGIENEKSMKIMREIKRRIKND